MSAQPAILLDTTVLVDALRNRAGRRTFIATLAAHGARLSTSAINVAELYSGLRPAEEQATAELIAGLQIEPLTPFIAEKAGRMRAELRRLGITRSLPDMIVAATALELGLAVATDNLRDFQIEGLNLVPLP